NVFRFAPESGSPICAQSTCYSRRQLFANAAIAASRVLRAAVVKLSKAKQVRQATAFKGFLFVALGGDFNKELRRCGRNGLCQCRGTASRKERAANLGNDLEGVYGPLVPWSSGIIHRCVQFVH